MVWVGGWVGEWVGGGGRYTLEGTVDAFSVEAFGAFDAKHLCAHSDIRMVLQVWCMPYGGHSCSANMWHMHGACRLLVCSTYVHCMHVACTLHVCCMYVVLTHLPKRLRISVKLVGV